MTADEELGACTKAARIAADGDLLVQVPLETKTVITTAPKNGVKVTVHIR